MSSDLDQLEAISRRVSRRLRRSDIVLLFPLLICRFIEVARVWKLFRIAPRYERDYRVVRGLLSIEWQSEKRSKRGKFLVFSEMQHGRLVSRDELKGLDVQASLNLLARIEDFLAIYELELSLALSIVPYTDLADELDMVIERYDREGGTLLREIERLDRRRSRQDVRLYVSGMIGLFSLILVTYLAQSVDLSKLVTTEFLAGASIFVLMLIAITLRTFWNYRPILQRNGVPTPKA